jgi:Cellulose synthase subunit D
MLGTMNRSMSALDAAALPTVWRAFLRGLALELDAQVGPDARIAVLRATGHQMAEMLALPAVDSLEALELEMNDVLAEIGWGRVELTLVESERCVTIGHVGLPRIGSAGEPLGTWLAPVLEGLYQGWMGQQPGADPSFRSSIKNYEQGGIVIRYGR